MSLGVDGTLKADGGHATGQCLAADDCDSSATPPYSLGGVWGWVFVAVLTGGVALYSVGGIVYARRAGGGGGGGGSTLVQHPHYHIWENAAGLCSHGRVCHLDAPHNSLYGEPIHCSEI
jgi:hypothetical protein